MLFKIVLIVGAFIIFYAVISILLVSLSVMGFVRAYKKMDGNETMER